MVAVLGAVGAGVLIFENSEIPTKNSEEIADKFNLKNKTETIKEKLIKNVQCDIWQGYE